MPSYKDSMNETKDTPKQENEPHETQVTLY